MNKGFTLAEVLITLAIIGVVAAMTVPTLVASYQKSVTANKLKKYYNTLQQVQQMRIAQTGDDIAANGDTSILSEAYNVDQIEEYWNTYYAPYFRTLSLRRLNKGILAVLSDGSGIYMTNMGADASTKRQFFCIKQKDCEKIEDDVNMKAPVNTVGKSVFLTWNSEGFGCWAKTREAMKTNCASTDFWAPGCCGQLIMLDGWEIKDDYPR